MSEYLLEIKNLKKSFPLKTGKKQPFRENIPDVCGR